MIDIPAPGTWVRLTHADAPAGSWHHVTGADPAGRLQLDCKDQDGDIGWALVRIGSWAVVRSWARPDEDVCRTCRFRTAFMGAAHPAVADPLDSMTLQGR